MSVKQIKSDLVDLLNSGLVQRGFTHDPLKKKEPNYGRHFPFRKITPNGRWNIPLDIRGVSCIASGSFVSIHVDAYFQIDDLSALLDDRVFLGISIGHISRGEAGTWMVSDGEGEHAVPTCVNSILDAIDTIVLPRLEKYSVLENAVECLARMDEESSRELNCSGFATASSVMAAIGGAFLLGKLDQCDEIARRADALWSQKKIYRTLYTDFLDRRQDFYERHLRTRGVKPDAWLLSDEQADSLRRERPPKPRPRELPSPSIWIDGSNGAEVPARFEYGYQLLVIGTENREFIPSLTEVAHKLTTGKYNLMMVGATNPGEKPAWGPYPISYRRLVIDGKWAVDWTPPPPSSKPAAQTHAATELADLPPSYPTKDPLPDNVTITIKDFPGWMPFFYRQGYAMYPVNAKKQIDKDNREIVKTLNEVAARLRTGNSALMMTNDRTGKMEIFDAGVILIDGKPAASRGDDRRPAKGKSG